MAAPPITKEYLISQTWTFFHGSGHIASHALRFEPDGTISGYDHPNERMWSLDDDCIISIHSESGEITLTLDTVIEQKKRRILTGRSKINSDFVLCLVETDDHVAPRFGTREAMLDEIQRHGWEIGEHTYGKPLFLEAGQAHLKIGKYCSIATNVTICFANHRVDTATTFPFATFRAHWPSVPDNISDHTTKGPVIIGNDVWIGQEAFICPGVKIGDGAVIGARAVVTKDVPAYAVVAGTPGRVVRYRFGADVIAAMLEISWWDWPDEIVDQHLPLMMGDDIHAFIAAVLPKARKFG